MIPGYAYTAMLVTGSLHSTLGVAGFLTASIGLVKLPFHRTHCGVALMVSMWTMLVGCLGIVAGIRHFSHAKIQQLKSAYMVTAILSACIFCLLGSWMFSFNTFTTWISGSFYVDRKFYAREVNIISATGGIITSLEFILAIVSSSICCCCSPTNENPTVIVQAPFQQIIGSVPINTRVPYQTLDNYGVACQPPPYEQNATPAKA